MRRAEKKLQLSHNVVGDDHTEVEGKEGDVETSDLRSIVFGLHILDPSEVNSDQLDEAKMSELNSMVEKVIAVRHDKILEKDYRKFEINPLDKKNEVEAVTGEDYASVNLSPGLDEASYLSWVEKLKQQSKSSGDLALDLGFRRNLQRDKHKLEDAKKKAEEKKLAKWEALGYRSLSVKDPINPPDDNILSDSGSVLFVVGDCTHPEKVCPSEPTIIFR